MSSKTDTLLKKATSFERLALYSDRKSFLQALSQQAPLRVMKDPTGPLGTGPGEMVNVPDHDPQGQTTMGDVTFTPDPAPTGDATMGNVTFTPNSVPTNHPVGYNKNTIVAVQNFLNKALRPDIIQGKLGPVGVDGKLGPETSNALKYWANKSNMPSNNVQSLINVALKSARV